MPSIVALIPARGGSKRIPRKNIKPLKGIPLLAWTICAARAAGLFTEMIVSTEDAEIAAIARSSGATIHARQPAHATDDAPDIRWVEDALRGRTEDAFAILRPTSPFRTHSTIRRAWRQFQESDGSSLRAVEPVKQHPGKMWCLHHRDPVMLPIMYDTRADGTPWHSSPTQSLPTIYIQNASLEMAWTRTVIDTQTIAGFRVIPFFTEGWEGFDINTPEDWEKAEAHVSAS